MCGMYAVAAVLAALNERRDSGRGQFIDLSLLDTQVAWLANQNLNYLVSGEAPGRRGTAHPNIVPYQAFRTSDGFLMLAVGNDAQFARFCAVAGAAGTRGRPALRDQPGPGCPSSGTGAANRGASCAQRTSAAVARGSARGQVPCGPINDLAQVFAEPQVRHRQLRLDLPHPWPAVSPGFAIRCCFRARRSNTTGRRRRWGPTPTEVLQAAPGARSRRLAALRSPRGRGVKSVLCRPAAPVHN